MPRYKDESPAVRVYTVCDESRYLIVRNVPELGCGDDLLQLFSSYGEVEECKPMDAEDCEKYTDVYWIKFRLVSNARFHFVLYWLMEELRYIIATNYYQNSIPVLLNCARRSKETLATSSKETPATSSDAMITSNVNSAQHLDSNAWDVEFKGGSRSSNFPTRISSNEDYFASQSMNRTVNFVRDKLDKIRSSGEHTQAGSASKKQRVDNRRRI
ncbi:uncharacterized protein LOC106777501 isoform X8 [Vigna radiata var. radiata]|uniref:Uncharacterized protein LOC106777501 isoform X8 n=1 Tax=Vigna radiata var. radiata TaxID=3916 RepID=A0A3Q0ESL3_VIGRR|nr:uncharacterized protein LOC106777501 isoform X8 [Vigna radiata var. radiata]